VSSVDASAADDPRIVALVGRAVARDQAAFAELYDLHQDRVYRYVYYRTANRDDAEDLTEQVFLQVWAAIERFRWQGKPVLAWLYTVALQRGRRLALSSGTQPLARRSRRSDQCAVPGRRCRSGSTPRDALSFRSGAAKFKLRPAQCRF